jgi:hypothetical protein
MTDWFISHPDHTTHFKNKTNMQSKDVDVKLLRDTSAAYGDLVISGRSDTSTIKCDSGSSGFLDNTSVPRWNYYIGANGKWWDQKRGQYGCPKIGIITGGEIKSTTCSTNRWDLLDGKAKCNYRRIYNPTEQKLPEGHEAQKFSDLNRYFEGTDLVKAQQSWCMKSEGIDGFDNIIGSSECTTQRDFNYKLILANLLPNDWYSTRDNCERFKKLGELLVLPLPNDTRDAFINKINQLPTSGTPWRSDVIKALNAVMITASVSDDIKSAISTRVKAYCNARGTDSGKSDPVCGCKNAKEGWNGSDPTNSTCIASTKGCADVVDYVNALKVLKTADTAAPILTQFSRDYKPLYDSQACMDAYASGGDSVLAPENRPIGEPSITVLCASIVQALDQATLSIKGNYNFNCNPKVTTTTTTTNTGGGTDTGADIGDDDEDIGGEDEDTTTPVSNNIWLWVIVGVFSLFLMLGVGASLLFLF